MSKELNLETRVNNAIKKIEKMSIEELEREFAKVGYFPVRKPQYRKAKGNAKVG